MDPMEEIRATFFVECEELLEALEAGLMAMSEGEGDMETVNAVFRAVHSIKGGAGAFALDDLVRFAHRFETTLDEVRAERLEPTPDVLRVLLRSADLLADLVRAARDEEPADQAAIDELLNELQAFVGGETEPAAAEAQEEEVDFQPLTLAIDLGGEVAAAEPAPENQLHIHFRPKPTLYVHGNETTLLFRALAELGELEISCDTTKLPLLDDLDPEGSYLEWTIFLKTEKSEADVHEVFEFVDGDCDLVVKTKDNSTGQTEPEAFADVQADIPEAIIVAEMPAEAPINDDVPASSESSPTISNMPAPSDNEAKVSSPRPTKDAAKVDASAPKATVRVDLERVDRLINQVGELVINQAMLAQCVEEAGLPQSSPVATGLDEFKHLTRDIQESVMAIRAQPVKSLFQRMSRIVREAADATGKSVRLITEGEATEVDKTVIERLADPLTHMIRNAVDHGLETPEERVQAGKPAEGVVRLSAAHRSGRVVIIIADDGAGINRERVKGIAIKKNLIPDDAQLSDGEIDNLLFMPGFSTAETISDLSGRGVGMDVVKRAIQSLGGRITITSQPGHGSTFSVSLPLTLAVLDGMVVGVADETVVVPLSSIVETLKPEKSDVHSVCDGANVVFIRDRFVPIVDAGQKLGFRPHLADFRDCVFLLIEMSDGTRSALVVDSIQDQRQVVIKGLEDNYGHISGVAAATILGDGRIALILDADTLVTQE
ncbi:MAG: chemotaxis protein CheA, partial [Pseudomonadota bacterium]